MAENKDLQFVSLRQQAGSGEHRSLDEAFAELATQGLVLLMQDVVRQLRYAEQLEHGPVAVVTQPIKFNGLPHRLGVVLVLAKDGHVPAGEDIKAAWDATLAAEKPSPFRQEP